MRLIDADALKESLKELKAEGNNRRYIQGLQDAIDDFFPQIIDDEPTIDAEPVKHARWIELVELHSDWNGNVEKITRYYCSACNNKETIESDYCRRCGAKMDGGADDGID